MGSKTWLPQHTDSAVRASGLQSTSARGLSCPAEHARTLCCGSCNCTGSGTWHATICVHRACSYSPAPRCQLAAAAMEPGRAGSVSQAGRPLTVVLSPGDVAHPGLPKGVHGQVRLRPRLLLRGLHAVQLSASRGVHMAMSTPAHNCHQAAVSTVVETPIFDLA